MTARLAALLFLAATACQTARVVGPPLVNVADRGAARVLVLEPFFENAEWKVTTKTEYATAYSPYGGPPRDVALTREIAEKPVYARVQVLAEEHRLALLRIQQLRPRWRVMTTSGVGTLTGPVTVVRTLVGQVEVVGSNRAMKNLACAFGFILPLLIFDLYPVDETQRVYGLLTRFDGDATDVKARLLRYPTQPDYAVDTRGLVGMQRPFGLDIEFEEGVLAPEARRDPVLTAGFVERLAQGIIAVAEEEPAVPTAAPALPPPVVPTP